MVNADTEIPWASISRSGLDPVVVTRLVVPGAGVLEFERERATGALVGVSGGGRQYLTTDADGVQTWPSVCTVLERAMSDGVVRHITTPRESWTERYRWAHHRLVEVDGVEIRRDAVGRVVACVPTGVDPAPPDHAWFYSYSDHGLVHIDGPRGSRSMVVDSRGRVRSVHEGGVSTAVAYGGVGDRLAASRPLHDHLDECGRCWATLDASGAVDHVYIWDGGRCLARIDGSVGSPLGAVFSLDPSATPVRVVEPTRTLRVPRDAYGEGLLGLVGVPGLFGGQVHGGLVHLPVRRLDPVTGSFCDPDPFDGGESDPRRAGVYEGPIPAEAAPRSAYEVCRGDPVGRADPTGGISAGLVISDLTWSLQNNLLTFFGIDWTVNMLMSLILAPFKGPLGLEYDFFDTSGLVASPRHGGFGVRRDGFIPGLITKLNQSPRAFTTQHIVWAPDVEFSDLDRGEVIDCGGSPVEFTHYGSILSITPSGRPRRVLQSMSLSGRDWVSSNAAPAWTRHGGVGVAVAPGTLTPWFPTGGIHLDAAFDTRRDLSCAITELCPYTVAAGHLESRSFLTAASATGLVVGDRVLVSDGTHLAIASLIGIVAAASAQRLQLDVALGGLTQGGITVTKISTAPTSVESRNSGPVANSIDLHGTTQTHAVNDLLRLTSGTSVTVARVARTEAQIPIDRPLPAGLGGPILLTLGAVGAAAVTVTMAGANIDFGAGTRPTPGTVGLVSGGGTDVAVRVESHSGASQVVLDRALPAPVTGAATITFRPVNAGTVIGSRSEGAEAAAVITYVPTLPGAAPDGSAGTLVVRCDAGAVAHARIVTGAPLHDVAVIDRPIAGSAPFTTERFAITGASIGSISRADVMALVLPDPAPFSAAPAVFLTKVAGATPAAHKALVTGDIVRGILKVTPSTAVVGGFEPGRPLLAGSRVAAVRKVRLTPTFDRPIDLSASGLRLVGLTPIGHAYLAKATASSEVLVQPQIDIGGAAIDVPFPRFVVGDLVNVTDRTGRGDMWHRVSGVSGGRISLVGGPALAAGDLIRVSAVATNDPGTGGPFLGTGGSRSGSGATTTATFDVWSTDACPPGRACGIVDGTVTHPAVVTGAAQEVEVTFSETFDAPGVTVSTLTREADRFVATIARDGAALLLDGAVDDLETGADTSIVAVAYTDGGTASVTGSLGPGSFLVPEGEDTEVTRIQGLTDHELQHTIQYAQWGPLWFNLFPMLAMELPGILNTDTELPEYSRFLDATVATGSGSRWNLKIPDTSGVAIGVGDELQLVQGSRRPRVKVAAINGTVYAVTVVGGGALPTGQVSVRKQQRATTFDRWFAGFQLATHGGLLNVAAGSTWGGIFWLLGKAFYGLGRAIAGTGDLYAATVQPGGGALSLTRESDTTSIRTEGRIIVRHGDNTVVRSMTRSGTMITLTENVAFTGGVRVAMYDTHDPGNVFDWFDYFPATVDADNPFVLTVEPAGDSTLQLSPEDRITVKYRGTNFNTDVLAVNGTTVELLEPIAVVDGERSLRIARVGASDPLGNADSTAMVEMGMGWMKWIFDPYGQIEYAAAPREEWARWLLRVMRWLLGTQNFSLLPLGYVWWFRLIPLIQKEHTAFIEQQASQESGDLYTPLGRVYGQREPDGWGRHKMVVGDVARYRYWPLDRNATLVQGPRVSGMTSGPGRLDATSLPGDAPANLASQLRTLPNLDTGGTDAGPPNGNARVGGSDPGTYVAEPFTVRDVDPRVVPGNDRLGFETSLLGCVPVGSRVQRMLSAYVAFTRLGSHRLTTDNRIDGADLALEAFTLGKQNVFAGGQTLFYDITVTDVTMTVAGEAVTTGKRVTMVPFQRAQVATTPHGSRSYSLAVPDPAGSVLRVEGTDRLVARSLTAPVPVEVSRVYTCTSGSYPPGGLALAGMHLSRDVHIPVRRFTVEVVPTLPLRATADAAAAAIASLARDADGFVLVPAPIVTPLAVTSVGGASPVAGAPDPVSSFEAPDAATFLGVGGVAFRVRFTTGSPIGLVVMTVRVGTGGASEELTCTFNLT
ncbi:hypothetical protein FHX52_0806 [Humibacillus xanthopallidus]|uniref:Uncharacterized protein n=1 Tax=Humibacillus xanthopallidus TaxID=412689 RepID=A0A543PUD7_9MICO|nr:hypothetical protein [Humibacillus xanthopallidus]TQN47697.1 hypothetical protein FHX52_0806 [Humibacillus xanthopallidus]